MNRPVIVVGVVFSVIILISLPLSILALGHVITTLAKAPAVGLSELITAGSGLFNHQTETRTTATTITIAPISEIALAKQTIKMTTVYKRSWYGSECTVVAEQDFVVKYGYDTKTVFRIVRGGGTIEVPPPLVLSVEPAKGAPNILFKVGGWYNAVNPDDVIELTDQMHRNVRSDQRVGEFKAILTTIITNQLLGLQRGIDQTAR